MNSFGRWVVLIAFLIGLVFILLFTFSCTEKCVSTGDSCGTYTQEYIDTQLNSEPGWVYVDRISICKYYSNIVGNSNCSIYWSNR